MALWNKSDVALRSAGHLIATLLLAGLFSACSSSSGGNSEPNPPPSSPANTPPTVNAGADQTLEWPENTVELAGSATDDGPSASLTYAWSATSGPAGVQFANANQAATTATFPGEGTYVLTLTVSDGALSGTDTLQVIVNPELYPEASWVTATPAEMSMDEALLDQARDYAVQTNNAGGSGMIVRRGRLVYSWGDTALRYDLKSTTKSMGGVALALALDDGSLSLDDLAQARLPTLGVPPQSNAQTGWLERITVGQLATHTAGFEKPDGPAPMDVDGPALIFEPGTTWSYSDAGLNWLADVLTVTFGQDLHAMLLARVWAPMGITSSHVQWRSNRYRSTTLDGIPRRELASGMFANVDAMARVGYLFLRKGRWAGQQLISEESVELLRTPHESIANATLADPVNFPDATTNHAVLWWTNTNGRLAGVPNDAYWAWGLGDSLIVVIPSLDLVIARATTQAVVTGAGRVGWTDGWNGDYAWLEPFMTPIVQSVSE